jgi:hypothetical protein
MYSFAELYWFMHPEITVRRETASKKCLSADGVC